jgi:WD40 repeat protein
VIYRFPHAILVGKLAVAVALGTLPTPAEIPLPVEQFKQTQLAPSTPKLRLDRFGDPLPHGALYRIGTARLHHGSGISGLAASPDGVHIVSAGYDGMLSIWEAATGREKMRLSAPLAGEGWLAFSPNSKSLVFNCNEKLCLFDVGLGKVVKTLGPTASSGTFAADGKTLTAVQQDGRSYLIRPWDLQTGKPLKGWTYQPELPVPGCTAYRIKPYLSHDGGLLATLETNLSVLKHTLRLWDGITGKERRRVTISESLVTDIVHSPDGKMLAVIGGSGTVRIFDAATGKEQIQWKCDARWQGCVQLKSW